MMEIFIPGSKREPDGTLLKRAAHLVPHLEELLEAAKSYAIEHSESTDAWWSDIGKKWSAADQVKKSCLNFFACHGRIEFSIDLVQVGDDSGNCWTVAFESGKPVHLDYA
jgi:hypothetical protein